MANLLKKRRNNSGYVLLESVTAFGILCWLVLTLVPMLIFLKKEEEKQRIVTEEYRLLYEMTEDYLHTNQQEDFSRNYLTWQLTGKSQKKIDYLKRIGVSNSDDSTRNIEVYFNE